jgi:hypothetical protein
MRFVIFFTFFCAVLVARDNPFAPSSTTKDGSLIAKELPSEPLRPELLRLPIDAVRVNRITVEYQRIDGTKERRTFEIDKQIAQDVPLLVKQ